MKTKSLPTLLLAMVGCCLLTGCHWPLQAAGALGLGTWLGDALSSGLLDDETDVPVVPPPVVVIRPVHPVPPASLPPTVSPSPCEGHPGNHLPAWCR